MSNYAWARRGDVNAFFGLMLDNVAVMLLLFSIITNATPAFTPTFVLTRMIPGTALGVLLGDLVYTWMAFRLARLKGNNDVTAMPLGLDTPSTFGFAFLVLLPALRLGVARFPDDHDQAMEFAWHVGLSVLVLSGVFKIFFAPFGNLVRKLVPRAGLLGSLAAIALALIAFLPMLTDDIAGVPLVGMVALVVILITLVAHRSLPFQFPGALAAVLVGVAIYLIGMQVQARTGIALVKPIQPVEATGAWQPGTLLSIYQQPWSWWGPVFTTAVAFLPVALPFALATIVGGIDCTESAAAAGDDYDTVAILMTEGVASLVAGLLGGVIQTTPYIGHPAYKKMGGRAAYTLANALFIGAVGCFGGFALLFNFLPKAAMFPILVFVGLEITAQSFHATPTRHYPAIAFAMLPALAYLIKIPLEDCLARIDLETTFTQVRGAFDRDRLLLLIQTLRCMANGFLISGTLWATGLALLLDGKLFASAGAFAIAGVAAFFGIIHSPLQSEQIGLPWDVLASVGQEFREAVKVQTPYHWAGAYALMAVVLVGLGLVTPKGGESAEAPVA